MNDSNELEIVYQNYVTNQLKIHQDKVKRMLRLREKMKTTKQTKKNDQKTIFLNYGGFCTDFTKISTF